MLVRASNVCLQVPRSERDERNEPLGGATLSLDGVIQRFYQSRD
jgi:hypothetical protein